MMLPGKVNHFRGNSPHFWWNSLVYVGYLAHSTRGIGEITT